MLKDNKDTVIEQDSVDTEQTPLQKAAAERKEVNLRKKKRGRPKKADVVAKKQGNRGQVGRPKGDAAIINEYKARMLASPKSGKVLEAIYDAALNDEHKHQAAAWKLIMDRMLPVSAFEKEVGSNAKPSIQINFGTIGTEQPNINIIEHEDNEDSNG